MVIPLGLSAPDYAAYEATLATSHRLRVRVELLDLNHNVIEDLSGLRMDGSVQLSVGDNTGPSRSASMALFDPTDVLNLEGAATTTAGADRMVRITRGVHIGTRWVDVPVITGPLAKASRQGDSLSIEVQDKVSLLQDESVGFTVKKGTNVATAIGQILAKFGETRHSIETTTAKLGADRVIGKEMSPWKALVSCASAAGWVVFYDGDGTLIARKASDTPVFTFVAGTGGTLLGGVQTGHLQEAIVNRVIVRGGSIAGVQIVATATVNTNHPLSPEKLARGDVPQYYTHTVEDTTITTFAAATTRAQETLDSLATQANAASFEALVVPHLDVHDMVSVIDPRTGIRTNFRLTEGTVPVTADGSMSVGYNSRTARSRMTARLAPKSAALKRAEAKARATAKKKRKK